MSFQALYELRGLRRTFDEHKRSLEVLKGLNLSIPQSKLVVIGGPSGAGKSTLLHVLGLLDQGYEGSLLFLGEELNRLSENTATRYRLERVGVVFQRYHVIDALTVLENVAWPYWRLHGDRRGALMRARELLDGFGMGELARYRPTKLSGGELQRVALARALVNRPAVILADEPTAQLDETNAMHIIEVLRELRRQGNSVVVVTHDPNLMSVADVIVRMSYGRVLREDEGHLGT
jgi:ABC-type lipoprotein export system ATPase subunit